MYGIPKRRGREWLDGARVGLYALVFAVSSYIGGSHGVREIFDSLGTGFQPNTQVEFARHRSDIRIRRSSLSVRLLVESADSRGVACAERAARWPVRREIRDETLTEIASRVARRRSGDSSIKRCIPALFARGDGLGGFHTRAQAVVELEVTLSRYGVCCFNM